MSRPTQEAKAGIAQQRTSAHFVLQGKGGVGKSLIAAYLAQYFIEAGRDVRCYDTDPVNATLARYKTLQATHLPLLAEGRLDARKFDTLMEDILAAKGQTFVVDNGASTFLPLGHYMAENNALELLAGAGVDVVTHCVVTGGQALKDTLVGLDALAKISRGRSIVVWMNEYFGDIAYERQPLRELPVYKNHAEKFRGSVTLARRNPDTFGADVQDMVKRHSTFAEAIGSADVSVMAKHRLTQVRQDVFEQLRAIGLQ